MSGAVTDLFRATIFHTPRNPFSSSDETAPLACFPDGALLVSHGRIVTCGEYDAVRAAHDAGREHDWRGGFILPGFVDAHVHFPQVRIIGALGLTLLDWLEQVALPEESRMADLAYAASTASLFLRTLASSGTTTALVFGAHFGAATAALFETAAHSGLRIATGLVMSDRLLRPELHQSPDAACKESVALIEKFHGRGRLRYAVTPRFAYSTTEAMLDVCQELMREHPGVLFQTHINEHRSEIDRVRELFPWAADYLDVYERYGFATRRSVFAHSVHSTPSEVARLAASRSSVAHCPGSNAALGSGIFGLRSHLAAGVTCALGTDIGGGINVSIMGEARQAYLTQRLAADPVELDAARLLYLATAAGARALNLDDEVGDFSAGKAADFIYLRPAEGGVLEAAVQRAESAMQTLAALFAIAGPESVRQVRVEGDIVYAQESTE